MKKRLWVLLAVLVVAATLRVAGGAGFWRRYATAMLGGRCGNSGPSGHAANALARWCE